jgi:hypothetical protein
MRRDENGCGEQVPFVKFLEQFRSGAAADRRISERGRLVRVLFDFELAGEPPALLLRWDSRKIFAAPYARHICRNKNQNVFSSVRSGIFRAIIFRCRSYGALFLTVTILQICRTYGADSARQKNFEGAEFQICQTSQIISA